MVMPFGLGHYLPIARANNHMIMLFIHIRYQAYIYIYFKLHTDYSRFKILRCVSIIYLSFSVSEDGYLFLFSCMIVFFYHVAYFFSWSGGCHHHCVWNPVRVNRPIFLLYAQKQVRICL